MLDTGSFATVRQSEVTGHPTMSTDGIGFVLGAAGRVSRSTVTGNTGRRSDSRCGPGPG
ncbi:hypothetical protein [Kitasatospora sp. NPDC050543]|uniref:hypothetical protein n=1 Tax=Kitasatospora sp. NPDC050543 TaxID=3364054 RepID=UPI00379FFACB